MASITIGDVPGATGGNGLFLKGEHKGELVDQGEKFRILAARPCVDGQFGPQVMYDILLAPGTGVSFAKGGPDEAWILALAHNEFRENQAKAIQKALATMSPEDRLYAWLGRFMTKAGNEGYELRNTPGAQAPRQPSATSIPVDRPERPAVGSNAPRSEEGIPFGPSII